MPIPDFCQCDAPIASLQKREDGYFYHDRDIAARHGWQKDVVFPAVSACRKVKVCELDSCQHEPWLDIDVLCADQVEHPAQTVHITYVVCWRHAQHASDLVWLSEFSD